MTQAIADIGAILTSTGSARTFGLSERQPNTGSKPREGTDPDQREQSPGSAISIKRRDHKRLHGSGQQTSLQLKPLDVLGPSTFAENGDDLDTPDSLSLEEPGDKDAWKPKHSGADYDLHDNCVPLDQYRLLRIWLLWRHACALAATPTAVEASDVERLLRWQARGLYKALSGRISRTEERVRDIVEGAGIGQ
jgi:hypothetical protein